jgi:hypothetical protein
MRVLHNDELDLSTVGDKRLFINTACGCDYRRTAPIRRFFPQSTGPTTTTTL